MQHLLRNLELYLTGAGVLVTIIVPSVGGWHGADWWQVAALTAAAVGVIHGLIFWAVRRRQRRIRAVIIAELRAMLKDRLNNRLMALVGEVSLQSGATPDGELLDTVHTHVEQISTLLDSLSEESLQLWQARYATSELPHADSVHL